VFDPRTRQWVQETPAGHPAMEKTVNPARPTLENTRPETPVRAFASSEAIHASRGSVLLENPDIKNVPLIRSSENNQGPSMTPMPAFSGQNPAQDAITGQAVGPPWNPEERHGEAPPIPEHQVPLRFTFPVFQEFRSAPPTGEGLPEPRPRDLPHPWPELQPFDLAGELQQTEKWSGGDDRLLRLKLEQKGSLWSVWRF
jgi:hypothetical protein